MATITLELTPELQHSCKVCHVHSRELGFAQPRPSEQAMLYPLSPSNAIFPSPVPTDGCTKLEVSRTRLLPGKIFFPTLSPLSLHLTWPFLFQRAPPHTHTHYPWAQQVVITPHFGSASRSLRRVKLTCCLTTVKEPGVMHLVDVVP